MTTQHPQTVSRFRQGLFWISWFGMLATGYPAKWLATNFKELNNVPRHLLILTFIPSLVVLLFWLPFRIVSLGFWYAANFLVYH